MRSSGSLRALPRVGISACLLGERVRHDGGHKLESSLIGLADRVEWLAVCPEVELGLPTPRPPIRLEAPGEDGLSARETTLQEAVRLRVIDSREDLTAAMTAFAEERILALLGAGMSGYVLKSGSPSCGLDVEVVMAPEAPGSGGAFATQAVGRHPGLFAAALLQLAPRLPIVEEDRLREPAAVADFLERVGEGYRRVGWTVRESGREGVA